jgi:hypothetical protein
MLRALRFAEGSLAKNSLGKSARSIAFFGGFLVPYKAQDENVPDVVDRLIDT